MQTSLLEKRWLEDQVVSSHYELKAENIPHPLHVALVRVSETVIEGNAPKMSSTQQVIKASVLDL